MKPTIKKTAAPKDEWDEATEVQSNWFKFEKLGDRIKGTLVKLALQKSNNPVYPDQWIADLQTENGLYHVGISVKKQGTVDRLKNCKMGEIIGILFESEGEPPKKGLQPAKYLKIVTFGMDDNYSAFKEEVEEESTALPDFSKDE